MVLLLEISWLAMDERFFGESYGGVVLEVSH